MVHKRRIAGWLIVPWKVSSIQESNYDSNVPINATLRSTIAIVVSTICYIWQILFEDSRVPSMIVVTVSMIQIPIVLAFTIKFHKKNSNINPIVPRTLQFHDDEVDIDGNIKNRQINVEERGNKTLVENFVNPKENEDSKNKIVIAAVNDKIPNVHESRNLPGQVCHM